MEEAHKGFGQHEKHAGERDDQVEGAAQALVDVAQQAFPVALGHRIAHLGEHRARQRHGHHAVGQLVPHPGVAQDRRAAGGGRQAEGVAEAEGHEVGDDVDDRGQGDLQRFLDRRVGKRDEGLPLVAALQQGGNLDHELHGDAGGGAHGQHDEGELGIDVGQGDIGDEGDDHDDVVERRRDRGEEEGPARVQHAGDHATQAVEDDLEGEDAEELGGGFGDFGLIAHGEGLGRDHLRGEGAAEKRERAQDDEREVEDVRGVAVGALLAALFALEQKHGKEGRRKETAGHELVHDVGEVVGHLVGAREHGIAEREGHRPGAHQAGDARTERAERHEPGVADNR